MIGSEMNMINYSSIYQAMVRAYSSLPIAIAKGSALPPLQVFIEVTYGCNLSCNFCQFIISQNKEHCASPDKRRELSSDEVKKLVLQVPRSAILSFTGGEPFVKKGFIDLLAYASGRNKTHIFTNGTRITRELAEFLVDLGARNILDSGLVLLGISLEGARSTHSEITGRPWAFDRTVAGLEALSGYRARKRKKYPLMELKSVISEKNVSELYEIYLIAKRNKVDIFNIMTINLLPQASRLHKGTVVSYSTPPPAVKAIDSNLLRRQLNKIKRDAASSNIQLRTTPAGFSLEEIVNYYSNGKPLKEYRCYYPWYGMGITAFGDVSLCPYAVIGNVQEASLKEILNNAKARKFRQELKAHKVFPGCWGCCMLVPEGSRKPTEQGT